MVNALLQDLKYGLRMLAKAPGFTAIAVLTLALGIGANTAIFSFTDQVLLRSLPVPNPEQLVILRSPGPNYGRTSSDGDNAEVFSYPMYKDLRDRATAFSGLAALFWVDVNVSGRGQTEEANAQLVSGNYFEMLEVRPALGRVFMASDETAPGANPVVVLSYGYWTRQYGADPSILNKTLTVNGLPMTVVGVARKGFEGVQVGSKPALYIPMTMLPQMAPTSGLGLAVRTDHWLSILGRLKPGISRRQAQASLQPAYASLLEEDAKVLKLNPLGAHYKEFMRKPLQVLDGSGGRQIVQQDAKEPLIVLMGMVGLVLLIACANLASLLIARGEARQREIAVRLAMGAGRLRLVRQLLTENLLIGLAGGAAGILLADWCLGAMVSSIPKDASLAGLSAQMDIRVLGFAAAATILTSIVFGLAPAMRATRVNLQTTLKDQGASVSGARSSIRLRKVLIVAQVALTAVLLVGAGLFGRTLVNLEHVNLGVVTDHILQFSIEPGLNGYTDARSVALEDSARGAITALPGVRSATASLIAMLSNDDEGFNITPEGYAMSPDEDTNVKADWIAPNFFSTMGTPLIAGREFTDADNAKSQKVAIINEALAKRFFAGRNPIGLHIARGAGNNIHPDIEIVGVVKDAKWDSARSEVTPFMYEPYAQGADLGTMTFYARTTGDPAQMSAAMRSVMRGLDANLPVNGVRTLDDQIRDTSFGDRLVALLSGSLALLAALLAALGLYGVLAYVVARRTREIGIRMAIGAQRKDVLWLIMGQGAFLTVVGGALGIAAALGAGQWIASLLYEVKPRDPATYAGVVILLALVSTAACYIPARRAMRVDPVVALRYE